MLDLQLSGGFTLHGIGSQQAIRRKKRRLCEWRSSIQSSDISHQWRAFMTSRDSNLPFSQFVEFVVDPRHQAGLVAALNERFERITRTYQGFIRASVQVSEDRGRVLSHVLWRSRMDCEKALENAEQGEGDLWAMIRTHRATAMTFNAYELVGETLGPR